MSRLVTAFAALSALVLPAFMAPAHAQIYYPWCAVYSGDMDGASNCGFSTLEQCRATISGMGGSCDPNPFYTSAGERPAKRVAKRPRKPAG